jgi:hypothetical protein
MIAQVYGCMSPIRKVSRVCDILGITTLECTIECFHKGQLFEVKKHMPNVIKTIVKCYKGFCGIYCQINSYVCAGLTSNHWHKEFIPSNTSLKMTPDDEMSVEKCIGTYDCASVWLYEPDQESFSSV